MCAELSHTVELDPTLNPHEMPPGVAYFRHDSRAIIPDLNQFPPLDNGRIRQ
jgi:hypothetical protein